MYFSFGFITDGTGDEFLEVIFNQIRKFNIPNYEIILVGNSLITDTDIVHIDFDDSIKPKWITRKKNIITEHAKYENIVYSHDYVGFQDDWYEGFVKFGNQWTICVNKILDFDGTRFRDWVLWADDARKLGIPVSDRPELGLGRRQCMLPYNFTGLSKWQYISGTYWVAKKNIMLEFPLNENILWGDPTLGEDVEWSIRVRKKYNFSLNPFSTVKFLRLKEWAGYDEITDPYFLRILNELNKHE